MSLIHQQIFSQIYARKEKHPYICLWPKMMNIGKVDRPLNLSCDSRQNLSYRGRNKEAKAFQVAEVCKIPLGSVKWMKGGHMISSPSIVLDLYITNFPLLWLLSFHKLCLRAWLKLLKKWSWKWPPWKIIDHAFRDFRDTREHSRLGEYLDRIIWNGCEKKSLCSEEWWEEMTVDRILLAIN